MSTSDSKRLDPGSLPVRVLMLAAGPDELLELLSGAAGELLLAVERCGRTLELDLRLLTAGPGGENVEENGEPGGGASERLGELLGERGWAPVARDRGPAPLAEELTEALARPTAWLPVLLHVLPPGAGREQTQVELQRASTPLDRQE